MRTAPGLRGGLAVVRPAGDAASDERARLEAIAAAERARIAALQQAGIQAGTTLLQEGGNAFEREQNRALQEQRDRAQLELERLRTDRDIELERIRRGSGVEMNGSNFLDGRAPPSPGALFTTTQTLAAAPTLAPTTPAAPTGVLGWMRANPVVTGIGVLGAAAVAYYAFAPKTKRGRRR
ncbi:MAG: hypothetical protein Q8Q09_06020 [Deltaproteobacteria bacterium]|nr:hypothetical protein [Deltaproteobacteria bacterium]